MNEIQEYFYRASRWFNDNGGAITTIATRVAWPTYLTVTRERE